MKDFFDCIQARTRAQAKYDKGHTQGFYMKFNIHTGSDISPTDHAVQKGKGTCLSPALGGAGPGGARLRVKGLVPCGFLEQRPEPPEAK